MSPKRFLEKCIMGIEDGDALVVDNLQEDGGGAYYDEIEETEGYYQINSLQLVRSSKLNKIKLAIKILDESPNGYSRATKITDLNVDVLLNIANNLSWEDTLNFGETSPEAKEAAKLSTRNKIVPVKDLRDIPIEYRKYVKKINYTGKCKSVDIFPQLTNIVGIYGFERFVNCIFSSDDINAYKSYEKIWVSGKLGISNTTKGNLYFLGDEDGDEDEYMQYFHTAIEYRSAKIFYHLLKTHTIEYHDDLITHAINEENNSMLDTILNLKSLRFRGNSTRVFENAISNNNLYAFKRLLDNKFAKPHLGKQTVTRIIRGNRKEFARELTKRGYTA